MKPHNPSYLQPIRSLWLASILSVTVIGVNAQTVFKCKNDQGQIVYSDAPCSYRADSIKIQQNTLPGPDSYSEYTNGTNKRDKRGKLGSAEYNRLSQREVQLEAQLDALNRDNRIIIGTKSKRSSIQQELESVRAQKRAAGN